MSRSALPRRGHLLALLALTAGCGSAGAAISQPPLPLLPTTALPGMSVTERTLSAADLTHDAPVPGFADKLDGWHYQSGNERVFVGRTKVFTNVVSRSLQFGTAAGAHAYVALVADRVASFFGKGSKVHPLTSAGRTGYVIEVAPCGCHRETPIVVALVSRGDLVSWLYGTGPGVRPATLRSLLVRAP